MLPNHIFRSQTALRFRPSVWWGNPWSALSGMAMTLTPGQICAGPNTWPDWLSPTQVLAWYTQWLISSGGFYNTPHGVANAILLPYVMRYNAPSCKERYADVAQAFGADISKMTADQASNKAIAYIKDLSRRISIPKLSSTAFKPSDVVTLSLHALDDTGMPENPREASLVDVQKVYMNAYYEQ